MDFTRYLNFPSYTNIEEQQQHIEGGPNWELLAPKSNRFYLPNLCGPAWQSNATTISITTQNDCLGELVDFTSTDPNKLHISSTQCPVLLKKSLVELFPAPEVRDSQIFGLYHFANFLFDFLGCGSRTSNNHLIKVIFRH